MIYESASNGGLGSDGAFRTVPLLNPANDASSVREARVLRPWGADLVEVNPASLLIGVEVDRGPAHRAASVRLRPAQRVGDANRYGRWSRSCGDVSTSRRMASAVDVVTRDPMTRAVAAAAPMSSPVISDHASASTRPVAPLRRAAFVTHAAPPELVTNAGGRDDAPQGTLAEFGDFPPGLVTLRSGCQQYAAASEHEHDLQELHALRAKRHDHGPHQVELARRLPRPVGAAGAQTRGGSSVPHPIRSQHWRRRL